ncbi:MAG: tRNA (guanosine(37)-N1)-methyltransferase TrmD [Patescibacteria group bacterium]|nr:tRNA (guanosine(37)-N1)-methyltransferase TrmD [Patescibacteria group bacterium]
MKFDILTIFPDVIYGYAGESILKRAQKAGLIKISAHNFRDYTKDKQRHVDDRPFGGGAGMVLQVQPIYDCLRAIVSSRFTGHSSQVTNRKAKKSNKKSKTVNSELRTENYKIIILDPAGKKFDQRMAEKFSQLDRLVLICGRYEGFDERIYKLADEKISVGDYVLSGGELPALVITEAVARLIPGVLGNEDSLLCETHNKVHSSQCTVHGPRTVNSELRTVESPQYTRPEDFMGQKVPKVLLSGNHKKIAEWRKKHSK